MDTLKRDGKREKRAAVATVNGASVEWAEGERNRAPAPFSGTVSRERHGSGSPGRGCGGRQTGHMTSINRRNKEH